MVATGVSTTQIDLTWSDVATGETGYEVWSSVDCINFNLVATTSADATSYSDTGLSSGDIFIYRIRAINATQQGEWSNLNSGCTDSSGATPIGIQYQRDYFTLQRTSQNLYDDAWQAHIGTNMNFTNPTNPLYAQELDLITDPTGRTLLHNNAFGNKVRLTLDGGATPVGGGSEYIIDNYTGLARDDSAYAGSSFPGNFGVGGILEGVNTANLYGYNDWFSDNHKTIVGIMDMEDAQHHMLPFMGALSSDFATSTYRNGTSSSYMVLRANSFFLLAASSFLSRIIPTRVHFKT